MKPYEKLVAKGAALLDKHKPDWWNGKTKPTIDLATLDLSNTCNCVLGQVYRPPRTQRRALFAGLREPTGYDLGRQALGIEVGHGHGFDVRIRHDIARRKRQHGILGQRWLELIRRRRRAAARKARRDG